MKTDTTMLRRLALFAFVGTSSMACVLSTGGGDDDGITDGGADDDGFGDTDDGMVGGTTGGVGDDDDGIDDGTTGGEDVGTTGGADGTTGTGETGDTGGLVCSGNAVADPGFEGTDDAEAWEFSSEVFGSPLCDESCTEDEGAAPYAGEYWIWFGGLDEAESAMVSQTVTIEGDARLSFYFAVNASAGTGEDVFSVAVDGTEVFVATDADIEEYLDYTRVTVDLSEFADGEPHVLSFEAEFTGEGMSSFFLDEVALETCDDDAGETGDDTGTDDGDTDDGTDGGDTDGGTGTPEDTEGDTGTEA